jgi:hypothetical protein
MPCNVLIFIYFYGAKQKFCVIKLQKKFQSSILVAKISFITEKFNNYSFS